MYSMLISLLPFLLSTYHQDFLELIFKMTWHGTAPVYSGFLVGVFSRLVVLLSPARATADNNNTNKNYKLKQ